MTDPFMLLSGALFFAIGMISWTVYRSMDVSRFRAKFEDVTDPKVGDVVQLRSGGPHMTLSEDRRDGVWSVVRFEHNDVCNGGFATSELRRVVK